MRVLSRLPVIVVALLFGATSSQFPEYVQQYSQRLGGAVDELEDFVTRFDEDARAAGFTREAALAEYSSSDSVFLGRRGKTVAATMARYEALRRQKAELDRSGVFGRVLNVIRAPQADIAERAWRDFKPAVPLTLEGALFAVFGFVLSLAGIRGAGQLPRLFRRRGRVSTSDTHLNG